MNNKVILSILLIGMLLLFSLSSSAFIINHKTLTNQLQSYTRTIQSQVKENEIPNDDNYLFEIYDIEFSDNAFHGPKGLYSYEWWYFDATLDNGYSVQVSIRCFNVIYRTIFFTGINLYRDGATILSNQKIYVNEEITVSLVEPFIKLDGEEILTGYIEEETGDWVFNLTIEIDGIKIDFTFRGETKGWKGLTPGIGWWGVVLPRAKVNGTLTIYDVEIEVTGTGYHDHNWEITAIAGLNYGWYWGKINTVNYTITWADIKMTRFSETPFLVINKKDGDYLNIPLDRIQINYPTIIVDNGKLIPESFEITVDYNNIQLRVSMDVMDTHFFRRLGIINYWRYHLYCTGTLTIEGITETIDEYNMAELLRFR
ncbi:MAG: hypothetical protein R6V50_04805 [Thermoplasmatota archaeon]